MHVDAERVADGVEEHAHGRGQDHGETMAAQAHDRLTQRRDRIVIVDHRSVSHPAGNGELHPGDALLGRLDEVQPQVVGDRVGEAADLADRLGAVGEQLRVIVDQPAGAQGSASLLVSHEGEDQITRWTATGPDKITDDRERHRDHVLHVDSAPPPQAPVDDVAAEGVHPPVRRIRRHHVEMTVDEKRRPTRVAAFDPGDDAGTARFGFQQGRLQADLGECGGNVLGDGPFVPVTTAPVHRVDPHQVPADLDSLILCDCAAYRNQVRCGRQGRRGGCRVIGDRVIARHQTSLPVWLKINYDESCRQHR